jgi:hypothetical protein
MRAYFDEALKTTEPLPMPKVTPPSESLMYYIKYMAWRILI